jgi:hypothetical protein
VLAAQTRRHQRRQPAENQVLGVDQQPLLVHLRQFRGIGLHRHIVPNGFPVADGPPTGASTGAEYATALRPVNVKNGLN